MSQLITRLLLDDNFQFNLLYEKFSNDKIDKHKKWSYGNFNSTIGKKLCVEKRSELIMRNYLATKMILSASVMMSSLEYSIDKNLKMVIPYLSYYSILTCCKAVFFTSPSVNWNDSEKSIINHSKIKNVAIECIKMLDKDIADEIKKDIDIYKNYRENFSYRFPSSGIGIFNNYDLSFDKTLEICKILCEIAELNSLNLQDYIFKNCIDEMSDVEQLDEKYIKECFCYVIDDDEKVELIDDDDLYRIDYISRKQPFPVDIYHTMTEGMVEDFFGSWCSHEGSEDKTLYNPDINWRIIFSVP